jgi:hypothetical protein
MLPLNNSVSSDWSENNSANNVNTALSNTVAVFSHRIIHDPNLTAVDLAINSSDSNTDYSQAFSSDSKKMDRTTVSHLTAGIFFTIINVIIVLGCVSTTFIIRKKCRARPDHEMIEMIKFRQYGEDNFEPIEMIDLSPNSPAVN